MEKNSNMPKYMQVEQSLIDDIKGGLLQPGDMLPTEAELSEKHGVSRVTIRKSLDNLVQKGYITKSQGRGSFVLQRKTQAKSPRLKSFTDEMTEEGKKVSTEVVTFNIVDSGRSVSKLLNIKTSDRVYFIERLRKADNKPMMFERTFMNAEAHKNVNLGVLEKSKIEYADKSGFEISYANQVVEATLAQKYIANYLKIEEGTPIVKVKIVTYLTSNDVFDYTELFIHPDNYQFSVHKERE